MMKIFILLNMVLMTTAVTLKVGLYNYIPDLADDGLESYKSLILSKWNALKTGIDLDLHVKQSVYDPYGDLDKYLGDTDDSFDLIETDMARKQELIGKVVEMDFKELSKIVNLRKFVKATLDAVKAGEKYIGLPTFACGNFILQVQKGKEEYFKINDGDFTAFSTSLKELKEDLVSDKKCGTQDTTKMERLLTGKITDKYGWYLPYIYIGAMMDVEHACEIPKIIDDVLKGNLNSKVIKNLRRFFQYFKDNCCQLDQKDTITDVVQRKAGYFFGFSEKLSEIFLHSNNAIKALNVMSPQFGSKVNRALLYTDAIVINKLKYAKKKKEIRKFLRFFTGNALRRNIGMGEDLVPKQTRYLMLPNKRFYHKTKNVIYKKLYKILKNGVSAPSLNQKQREEMQKVLSEKIFPN